jgi:hypothetical protein
MLLPVCGIASSVRCKSSEHDGRCSQCDYPRGASAVSLPGKSGLCAGMRTTRTSLPGLWLVGLVELLTSYLPHFSCAQRLLAEKMITIVAHFLTDVVKFIFNGRNSGQEQNNGTAPLAFQRLLWCSGWTGLPARVYVLGHPTVNCCAWDRGSPHLRRLQGCRFARRIGSDRRNTL